jgi:hypothetical protein
VKRGFFVPGVAMLGKQILDFLIQYFGKALKANHGAV